MNDKIKINLQMAGFNLPPHHTARGGRNGKRSRQTGGYTAQCVSRTLPECDSRKDYSHGGLSICFGEPEMKNRNDTRPYADKIEELTEVLETYFKGL